MASKYALGAIAFVSTLAGAHAASIQKRSGVISTTLPGSWVSEGCYVDVPGRTLTGSSTTGPKMTQEYCINFCSNAGYIYAGTEYSDECYCGSSLASGSGPAPTSDCGSTCAGNGTEACGGGNRLNLFWSGTTGPQTNPGYGNWTFSGCYAEPANGRTLTYGTPTTGGSGAMTVDLCLSACQLAGYPLAGVEYAGECYCGSSISNGGVLASDGLVGCNMLCNGNKSEFCGGPGRLGVYDYNKVVTLPPYTTVSSTTTTKSSTSISSSTTSKSSAVTTSSSTSSSATSTTSSTSSSSTSSFKSTTSSQSSSSSTSSSTSSSSLSLSTSTSSSSLASSTSTSSSVSPTTSSSTSSSTSTSKSTSSSQTSSSTSSSSQSSSSSTTVPTIVVSSSTSSSSAPSASPTLGIKKVVGAYSYLGCYTEATNMRALSAVVSYDYTTMTLEECQTTCYANGPYAYFGVEYGGECYCGNTLNPGSVPAPVTDCSFICPGSSYEYCGAGNRLELYQLTPLVTTSSSTTSSSTMMSSTTSASSSSTSVVSSTVSTSSSIVTSSTVTSSSSTPPTSSSTSPTSTVPSSSTSTTVTSSTSSSSSTLSSTATSSSVSSSSTSLSTSISTSTSSSSSVSTTATSSTSSGSSTSSSVATSSSTSSTALSTSSSTSTSSSSSSAVVTSSSTSSIVSTTSTMTSSSASVSPTLGITPSVGLYSFQGCYTEATNARALSAAVFYDNNAMTLEECSTSCKGYTYFGVEYGVECYCGNVINAGSALAPNQGDCSFVCNGNHYEYCGAGSRLQMYMLGRSSASSTVTTASSTSSQSLSTTASTVSMSSTASTGTGTSTSSAASSTSTGFTYQGCYIDGANGRILNHQQPDSQTLTHESCIAACQAAGYTIAGMEYAVQCFCDNSLYNGAALAANPSDCNDPCSGNGAQMCGGGGRMTLYSVGTPNVYQAPAVQTTGLPANWAYKGCLQDNIPSAQDPNEIVSTFPYMVWNNGSNDAVACITQCQLFGFNAAGLEYGSECYCGDVANIQVASQPGVSTNPNAVQNYYRSAVPQIVPDSQCNSPCSANSQYLCGSGNLMSYYAWEGPTPLYEFGFPTGNAAGEYSLLIGGVIVPLMTAQAVTGKVEFIEKYGTGEPNGTGAYELDLSEINNFSAAWRALSGLETDVFCSAGLTLPDKAGRIVTVGGWAGQSNFGVRTLTPDGSPGVQGTAEWQEDAGVVSLQLPRWYPSAMVMANGSILVVGGEVSNNDAENPTAEILPPTGVPDAGTSNGYSNTTVYLDFLDRTQPFNLYPFVAVCPSGIFIAYYNEARILDETTLATKKVLPNMPGAVNDPTGGRSYQLEGAMSLLPQWAPYTENLGVLICGGSTSGGGYAIDNCISTRPEDDEPEWTIERMPSRRVMPCMAGLPDGTYILVNGGQHGVAGFGLGGDPNYNAVLYDPTKPVNQRMSVMANTTVARLYHSEAIVLLDGRVMISGSDPTGDYGQPGGEWPEEYRVEVFTPPYLLGGAARPAYTMENTDWDYGESIPISVTSGTCNHVSMLGSVVSTHGNAMGQRTIFPALSCSGTSCTITAPPNAHQAPPGWYMVFCLDGAATTGSVPSMGQFIRIGKDPANIGNWPANVPAFAPLPGV